MTTQPTVLIADDSPTLRRIVSTVLERAGFTVVTAKDGEAPELVSAIAEVIQAADAARGGRPPLRPDPVEVGDDEVMARVSELLDRKLFEASVSSEVTQIAADVH